MSDGGEGGEFIPADKFFHGTDQDGTDQEDHDLLELVRSLVSEKTFARVMAMRNRPPDNSDGG